MGSIELMPEWKTIEMNGIEKLKKCIEGVPDQQFSSQDYMLLYTCVYSMCTKNPPNDHEEQLYNKYRETIEEYITSTVLPSLDGKNDEFLLRELVKRWENHRMMVRWLSRFFQFLDRYYVIKQNLPPLHKVGFTCFRDLVYNDINGKVRDAVISLIDQEREGEQIDGALLKNVVDFFVEVGMGHTDCYENDFEAQMLLNTTAYYSRKASIWILEDSGPDYRRKAQECLKQEKDRVANYLQPSSEQKLLQRVEHELLNVHGKQLSEDEHSGSHA